MMKNYVPLERIIINVFHVQLDACPKTSWNTSEFIMDKKPKFKRFNYLGQNTFCTRLGNGEVEMLLVKSWVFVRNSTLFMRKKW